MASIIGTLTRAATRRPDEPLNILTFPTHESYESGVAKTGHQFWAARAPGIKDWNSTYRPLPENYVLLNPNRGEKQLPPEVDFDLVLSQNKFGQFSLAYDLAKQYHLPLVSIEHTLPHPGWPRAKLEACREMKGDINLFISEFSRKAWGWSETDAEVVHHGIDTEVFSPNEMLVTKRRQALSVVNDWKNRDWCCGYEFWKSATEGLPVKVVGATPGLSEPAKSVHELVRFYRQSHVFVNTSLISPVPTALLEAMSCGCAVVSTANCMIPEIIENGQNGVLVHNQEDMKWAIRHLLDNPARCRELGENARRTIIERFSMDKFVSRWNDVFHRASLLTFTGQ